MADVPVGPSDQITGRALDAAAREHLLAVLQEELAQARRDALARGMSPDELAAQLDERIARLRAHTAELHTDDS